MKKQYKIILAAVVTLAIVLAGVAVSKPTLFRGFIHGPMRGMEMPMQGRDMPMQGREMPFGPGEKGGMPIEEGMEGKFPVDPGLVIRPGQFGAPKEVDVLPFEIIESDVYLTRNDLVTLIYNAKGYTNCSSRKQLESDCNDVKKGTIDSCRWKVLMNKGIIDGYSNGSGHFTGWCGPKSEVNRAGFIKILVSVIHPAMKGYNKNAKPYFNDVNKNEWYYDYIQFAAQKGYITTGVPKFFPNNFADYYWAADIIKKYVK